MSTRVWRIVKKIAGIVVKEAARTLARWASRRQSRNRRPWQHRRE